jgi:cyanobactin maturation PatA/PatG family protease
VWTNKLQLIPTLLGEGLFALTFLIDSFCGEVQIKQEINVQNGPYMRAFRRHAVAEPLSTLEQRFDDGAEQFNSNQETADALKGLGQGNSRVCIAVLDGPVDLSHPCFQGADLTIAGSLLEKNCTEGPALEHGTHVASMIFGQPGSVVVGVAPFCRGLLIPIFADRDGEHLGCSQLDLARAILLAVENGAHVINISSGQQTLSGEPEPFLAQAIETSSRHNVLIVAAAGNDGCDCLHVPAAGRSVLAVGAIDRNGVPLASSNWGSLYNTQGILAPGVDMLGAVPGGGAVRRSGTSFAAPFVSGLVGLLASLQIDQGKTPDPQAIRTVLLKTVTPCLPTDANDCRKFLAGQLNVQAATAEITRGDEGMTEELAREESDVATLSASEGAAPLQAITVTQGPSGTAVENGVVRMSGTSETSIAPRGAGKAQVLPASIMRSSGRVTPSDCGCGGGENCTCGGVQQKPALVFALGQLSYDFGTDARRDTFKQHMNPGSNNPFVPSQLIDYLKGRPYEAARLIWVLTLDETPIYAIQPAGPYATEGYDFLITALEGQLHREQPVELISVPGFIGGSVRLYSGQIVPLIVPTILGMYAWNSARLVEAVLGPPGSPPPADFDSTKRGLLNFINRVYYDLRNLGITGAERALNFSVTNLIQALEANISVTTEHQLDTICVERSPVCRPDSECYDVKVCFFNPTNVLDSVQVIKFTVDVSDIMPVSIGPVRNWAQRDCAQRIQIACQ